MRIRIRLFTYMRIRILAKGMRICDHWSTDTPGLHFGPPCLHYGHHWPSTPIFDPQKLLNFDFYMRFGSGSSFQNNAISDPDPQPCFLPPPPPTHTKKEGDTVRYLLLAISKYGSFPVSDPSWWGQERGQLQLLTPQKWGRPMFYVSINGTGTHVKETYLFSK